jgi:hypothetical protein
VAEVVRQRNPEEAIYHSIVLILQVSLLRERICIEVNLLKLLLEALGEQSLPFGEVKERGVGN